MLYEGAAVTTFQTVLLVYQFVLRHSYSTKTFTEFLQLLAVLLPKAADLPKCVYLFKKLASLFPEAQSRKHYYCTTCQMPVEKDGVCDCGQTNISQFITVPLQPQLKRLMEGKVNTPTIALTLFLEIHRAFLQIRQVGICYSSGLLGLFLMMYRIFMMERATNGINTSLTIQPTFPSLSTLMEYPCFVPARLRYGLCGLWSMSCPRIKGITTSVNLITGILPQHTHAHTHTCTCTHTLCHKLHDQIR